MPLWKVCYKHYQREDSNHEVEHDIEADDRRSALLQFLELFADEDEEGTVMGEAWQETPVREAVDAFLATGELPFWYGDADLYRVYAVEPEDTVRCPTCAGQGRLYLEEPRATARGASPRGAGARDVRGMNDETGNEEENDG